MYSESSNSFVARRGKPRRHFGMHTSREKVEGVAKIRIGNCTATSPLVLAFLCCSYTVIYF